MKHSARHTKIGPINYAISRSFRRRALLLTGYIVAGVALSPLARAVDPPPVGGYPGENTALGEDALFTYDTSIQGENTACGHDSLYNLSTGIYNTALGDDTLHDSTVGNNNTIAICHPPKTASIQPTPKKTIHRHPSQPRRPSALTQLSPRQLSKINCAK